jgi:hypothetical protein
MAGRLHSWLLDHLPPGVLNLPAEWLLAFACLLSGQAAITGFGRVNTISTLLYPPIYYAWGGCLVLGGVALVWGLASIRRIPGGYVIARLAAYLLGLRLLGIASLAYAIAVLVVAGRVGIVAAATASAFAGMCAIRVLVVRGRDE